MAAEEWRVVPGFDHYEVSDAGRVRRRVAATKSRKYPAGYVLSPVDATRDGYKQVTLCQDGRRRRALVHQLVAIAFIGPQPLHHEVSHLDGVPWHNAVGNLVWETHRENEKRKLLHGTARFPESRRGERNPNAILTWEVVAWIRTHDPTKRGTTNRLARKLGLHKSTVGLVFKGLTWKSISSTSTS